VGFYAVADLFNEIFGIPLSPQKIGCDFRPFNRVIISIPSDIGMVHDRDHSERVKRLALFIAEREGGDLKVIEIAAELHDIARDRDNHAVEGAKIAADLLRRKGYPEDFIKKVCHCIEAHSFSSGIEPKTLEAKILSDADKLDAMGAVGIARAFMFAGELGRSLEDVIRHFEEKLLKLKDTLYTETAKKLAEDRHRFLKEFYNRLLDEVSF